MLLTGCSNDIPNEENIIARYNYFTDVGHFRILGITDLEFEGHDCNFILWELEAIELLKGGMQPEEKIFGLGA